MGVFWESTFSTASAASNVTNAKFGGALTQTSVTFGEHRLVHELLLALTSEAGSDNRQATHLAIVFKQFTKVVGTTVFWKTAHVKNLPHVFLVVTPRLVVLLAVLVQVLLQ